MKIYDGTRRANGTRDMSGDRSQAAREDRPLPNFCAYLSERFGPNWVLGPSSVSRAEFRIAKRHYEQMIGCRVYSSEYQRMFPMEAA